MALAAATTMIKMLESLPEPLQDRVLEHMRDYIEDLRDEAKWDQSFSRTQGKLAEAARQARKDIAAGKAAPMDMGRTALPQRARRTQWESRGCTYGALKNGFA